LSGYRIEANKLRTTRILSVKTESQTVKTFTFKDRECAKAKPGQFLMLWIPGVDEIPLSILNAREDGTVSIAVRNVGEATQALNAKRVGEVIGIRGPFGNSFALRNGRILIVGGGTGTVPLYFLIKRLTHQAERSVLVLGAKTKDELLFMDEVKKTMEGERGQFVATTEDGSYGIKGLCTEPLKELLEREKFDVVYACGPERMIRKIFDLTKEYGIDFEASLERLMKCAVGLCGSCAIGKYCVCKDGPIFNSKQLEEVKEEFGVSKRDFDGKRTPI
jgi:dihydroorotate dehydrogenase electron transfer subunit